MTLIINKVDEIVANLYNDIQKKIVFYKNEIEQSEHFNRIVPNSHHTNSIYKYNAVVSVLEGLLSRLEIDIKKNYL